MKRNIRLHNSTLTGLAAIGLVLVTGGFNLFADGQHAPAPASAHNRTNAVKPDCSPYPDQKIPARVYWGVAHVHTGFSFDSGMFGVKPLPGTRMTVTERAYTSPIWYAP